MVIYEKDDKHILIYGIGNGTIVLFNVEDYSIVTKLQAHADLIEALSIYDIDSELYLASGSRDCTVKIWSLDDYKMTKSLLSEGAEICSLLVINNDDTKNDC